MEKTTTSISELFWAPPLGMKGLFTQRFFQHANIVGGVGVGGGSLVYAAVLLEPKSAFYSDPAWANLGIDWEAELRPHYLTAAQMVGRSACPTVHTQDIWLQQTAAAMGASDTYGPVPLGIYFGPHEEMPDPYFNGAGPQRSFWSRPRVTQPR